MARGHAGYDRAVPASSSSFEELLETLKQAAAALREADVRFVLGGGLAIWARGGPETEHDVDFFVKREDAERAAKALERAGFRTEEPPEDWLYKGWRGDVMVVVAEHRVDGQLEPGAGARNDLHLVRLAVRGQVAGE